MSIAALNQVYDEVRRLSIAGSDLAANDFRLKKLVPPLRKSAAKAPVFGKVADSIETVLECTPQNSAQSLLELGSLVTAILYTQGETGAKGTLKPLKTKDVGLTVSATSARVLKPLIEALTTTGSGRLEIIRDAQTRGGFKDLRLIKHAVGAIDDPYPEIGDFVCDHVLPIYGKAIYPELKDSFQPKGKGGHARRLRLMHKLDPEATRDLVTEVLEEGSKEVKLAAMGCLEGRADAVDFLLEQAKSRTKDIRAAAFRALASIDHPEVVELLKDALTGKEPELVAPYMGGNTNKALQSFVLERVEAQLGIVLDPPKPPAAKPATKKKATKKKTTTKTKKDVRAEAVERLYWFLGGVLGRKDKAAEKVLLKCFSENETFAPMDGTGYIDGDRVVERITHALLLTRSKASLKTLADAQANLAPNILHHGFVANALLTTPKAVFDTFNPIYLDRPSGKTKAARLAQDKAHAIAAIVTRIAGWTPSDEHAYYDDVDSVLMPLYKDIKLDPRWLDVAVDLEDTELVLALAVKKNKKVQIFLSGFVQAQLKKKRWDPDYQLHEVLRTMIRVEHPELIDLFIEVMKRAGKKPRYWWESYYLVRVIPELPKEALPLLEALVPDIHKDMLDTFVEHVDELKRKHESK